MTETRRPGTGAGKSGGTDPRALSRAAFVARFGGVFEHSPWIAEAAHDAGLPDDADTPEGLHRALCAALRDTPEGLHRALCAALRDAPEARQRSLIQAHPNLAGRLARAGTLTPESTREQAGAGLDSLGPAEVARFTALNDAYRARFGFPFILAVGGRGKADILAAFEARLKHDPAAEFAEALAQIERIALLRLNEIMGRDAPSVRA